MTEKYTGIADDKRYKGDNVDITFSPKRCIHAAECVTRLSTVFDTDKRPWIQPDNAENDAIATVVELCPSGALHYQRKDDGAAESIPDENTIILWHNGPLQIKGDLTIEGATVVIEQETRATLCRCGASEQKPFCDNSHKKIDFVTEDIDPSKEASSDFDNSGKVTITATENGPLQVEGNFRIETQDGTVLHTGKKTWLCRCGDSNRKPFCDGTHNEKGFVAE